MKNDVSLHSILSSMCARCDTQMQYDIVSNSFIFTSKLDPKGFFRVSYRIDSYIFTLSNGHIEDVYLAARENALYSIDIFLIIKECLRAGRFI